MIDKLREAQRHATRKIREQAQQIAMLQELVAPSTTSQITDKLAKK